MINILDTRSTSKPHPTVLPLILMVSVPTPGHKVESFTRVSWDSCGWWSNNYRVGGSQLPVNSFVLEGSEEDNHECMFSVKTNTDSVLVVVV